MTTPEDYIEKYTEKSIEVEKTLQDLLQIIQSVSRPEELEGNSFYHHQSIQRFNELFTKQVNLTWCGSTAQTKICEIGFNAGHSAFLFLLLNTSQSLQFTIFDIGEHSYTMPCLEYIANRFSHVNFLFTQGDSTETIHKFISNFPHEKETYDVVHVDGGHSLECALSDINSAIFLLKQGGYLIIDDTNIIYVNTIISALLQSNNYKEVSILPTQGYEHRILQKLV